MNAEITKSFKGGFTPIGNAVFRSDLSLKARGLLCTMLSLPKDWHFSIEGLMQILKEGREAMRTALAELKKKGFLVIEQVREKGKIVGTYWIITDSPNTESPNTKKFERKTKKCRYSVKKAQEPESEKPESGKPTTGKQPQYNKQEQNKKELNTPYIPQRGNLRETRKSQIQELLKAYTQDSTILEKLHQWLEVRSAKKIPATKASIQKNLEQLTISATQSGYSVSAYLDQVIMRGWGGFFPIPTPKNDAMPHWLSQMHQGETASKDRMQRKTPLPTFTVQE